MDAFNGSVKRKNKRLSLKKTRATIPNGEEREITEDNDVNILPYNGLINTGNTCYANVIIQSLKYTPHFIETLNHTEISCLLMQELRSLVTAQTDNGQSINPSKFITKLQCDYPQFAAGQQHDCVEYLNIILDKLVKIEAETILIKRRRKSDDKDSFPPVAKACKYQLHTSAANRITSYFTSCDNSQQSSSINDQSSTATIKEANVKSLFNGVLSLTTRCLYCECEQKHIETFNHLSIPVGAASPGCHSNREEPYSLHWSMSQFATREYLEHDNKYNCHLCHHLTEAIHSVSFSTLPSVMVLHLKCFSTHSMGHVTKATGTLSIPLYLSYNEWCDPSCMNRDKTYELYSVIFHTGSSYTSGHYTVCIKKTYCDKSSEVGNCEWILFDDEHTELMTVYQFDDIMSPLVTSYTPYVLFYYLCQ
jgi:ubiquitin C-terminal hydrolase